MTRASFGPLSETKTNPAVEIAGFAGQPLIDLVGDLVADPPPGADPRLIAPSFAKLCLAERVPEPEAHRHLVVGVDRDRSHDQRFGVDRLPVAEGRQAVEVGDQ